MKKIALTIAIVFGLCLCSFAQGGGGLFQRGPISDEEFYGAGYFNYTYPDRDPYTPLFPSLPYHDLEDNQNAPLGGSTLLLIGFGAAYAMKKRSKK